MARLVFLSTNYFQDSYGSKHGLEYSRKPSTKTKQNKII